MGLIKDTIKNAANAVGNVSKGLAGSAGGALLGGLSNIGNQAMFQEYLTSGDMSGDIIMKRAEFVKTNGSTNTKSDANVISNGSLIDVQHNQCMIIVENGKIVEACMEPGRFIYNTDLAPSFFAGNGKFTDNVVNAAKEMWEQAKLGGQRRNTQRVYFINMGILDEPFHWGLGNVPFRHSSVVADNLPPLRINMMLKGNGLAKIRVVDPIAFFTQKGAQRAGGDNNGIYTLSELQGQLFEPAKSKIRQTIAAAVSDIGMREAIPYTAIMTDGNDIKIEELVNEKMQTTELGMCGFAFSQFSVNGSFMPRQEDMDMLIKKEAEWGEKAMIASDTGFAQYDVMKTAAANDKGAGQGFMGLGMMGFGMNQMNGMGGMMGMQNRNQPQAAPAAPAADGWKCDCGNMATGMFCSNCGQKKPEPKPAADAWQCECGNTVNGNFCPNCGKAKPIPVIADHWVCTCGAKNQGRFCPLCGTKKPANEPLYRCDKCGWAPADPKNPPRFCPECGDPFNEEDIQE